MQSRDSFLNVYNKEYEIFDIFKKSKGLQETIHYAQIFSQVNEAILIESTSGPEQEFIIQTIHMNSQSINAPLIALNLSEISADEQAETLFGNFRGNEPDFIGMLEAAHNGTLVIQGIDKLTLQSQFILVKYLRSSKIQNLYYPYTSKRLNVRVIATTSKKLDKIRLKFKFRSDLFFMLKSFRLRIPNLRERPEDIPPIVNFYFQKFCSEYKRYPTLTEEAINELTNYYWEGNSLQLRDFCERLVVTQEEKDISAKRVQFLLHSLYHDSSIIYSDYAKEEAQISYEFYDVLYADEKKRIEYHLQKNKNNRQKTAEELGISTSTLWRRMKKYNIQ